MNTENETQSTPPLKFQNVDQLIDLRKRIDAGEEVSRDELRAAIEFLRQDRVTAASSGKGKAKSKGTTTQVMDLASLFAPKKES